VPSQHIIAKEDFLMRTSDRLPILILFVVGLLLGLSGPYINAQEPLDDEEAPSLNMILDEDALGDAKRKLKKLITQKNFTEANKLIQLIPTPNLNSKEKFAQKYFGIFEAIKTEMANASGLFGKEEDLDQFLQKAVKSLYKEAQLSLINKESEMAKDLLIHIIFLHRQNFRAKRLLELALDLKTGEYKVQNMETKYWEKSSIYFYGGNYEKAVDALRIYAIIDADNAETYERMGSSYYMQGENKKAVESWTTALFLSPNNKELEDVIKKTQGIIIENNRLAKERRLKKKEQQEQEEVPEGETQLLGVFPTRSKAYAYAQKLQKQGMTALVNELDNGKWAVKVPKSQMNKDKK
jgi:tetratricopeptide (TPR) repeat protein